MFSNKKKFRENIFLVYRVKPANPSMLPGILVQYHLHRHCQDATILAESSVLSRESLCPPFKSCPNKNLFQQFFGIEFHHNDHTYVRTISTYEFSRCFGLVEIFSIGYLMTNTNLDWMQQCQAIRHLGYSTRSIPILCTCTMQTVNSFHPISLLPPRPQFRLSSMAPFVPAFLQRSGGYRHIPTTLNYAQFVTLH